MVLVIGAELFPHARLLYAVSGFPVVFKTLDSIVPGTFIGLHIGLGQRAILTLRFGFN